MTVNTLQPINATRWERAQETASGERWPLVDVDIIRRYQDPWTCPEHLLNFLAFELSVDIWNKEWPDAKKRYVIANSIRLHRLKGTKQGIAEHIGIADAELKRAIVPPAKTFLMPALTLDERKAFLARFPQLRIYPFVTRSHQRYGHFTSQAYGRAKAFLNDGFPADVGTQNRWVRIAKQWDRGVETVLTSRTVHKEHIGSYVDNEYDEVILPSDPSKAIFLTTAPKARLFLIHDLGVAQRTITVPRADSYDWFEGRAEYTTVQPDLGFIDVRPEMVSEVHPGQPGALYPGAGKKQFIGGKFVPPTISWKHIFERWYLLDPDRVPDQRKRSVHLGYTRLGMPAFNAELLVAVRGQRRPREVWGFVSGHLRQHDPRPLDAAVDSVRTSKAARDKILINTKTKRLPRAGDRLKVGSTKVGQLIEA